MSSIRVRRCPGYRYAEYVQEEDISDDFQRLIPSILSKYLLPLPTPFISTLPKVAVFVNPSIHPSIYPSIESSVHSPKQIYAKDPHLSLRSFSISILDITTRAMFALKTLHDNLFASSTSISSSRSLIPLWFTMGILVSPNQSITLVTQLALHSCRIWTYLAAI